MAIKLTANWAPEDEIQKKLQEAFPGSTIRLSNRGGLCWGTVQWSGFTGKSQEERKLAINEAFFKPLGRRQANILSIVGLAPNEILSGPKVIELSVEKTHDEPNKVTETD
jgi:hypothetical protein